MPNILISVPTKKIKQPLSVTHPELAKEADGWDPSVVSAWSNKKYEWICPQGHSYQATVAHRSQSGSNCPYCSGNKVLPGFNDLATTHPNLASEADGWDPTTVSRGSSKKLGWVCTRDHHWYATVGSRASGKNGCPYCANKVVLRSFNDLATTHPEIAAQAHGWDPTLIIAGSSKVVKWKCSLGHIWEIAPHIRTRNDAGCPICINRRTLAGFNDFATTHPHLILELNQEVPSDLVAGSHKKLSWKCASGHVYVATIRSRALRGTGCGICANNVSSKFQGNLLETHPELAGEAAGWDPASTTAGSQKSRQWRCALGHLYLASPGSRVNMKSGCSICAGKKVLVGFNDLFTKNPEIAREAFGWDPKTITSGSSTKRKWKCPKGHIYVASPKTRTRMKTGCAICSNQKCLTGFNDMATTHPELAREAFGWDPTKIVAGGGKNLKWKCSLGHIWVATGNSRANAQQTGCPSCTRYGFDPNIPGFFYFLENLRWNMYEIGITNYPIDRIASHSKLGWEVIEIRGPMDGLLTQQWETAILRMLKAKGADLSNDKIAGKFDGYSEAWSKSTFEVSSIKELMRLTEEFESE